MKKYERYIDRFFDEENFENELSKICTLSDDGQKFVLVTSKGEKTYIPNQENVIVYDKLYEEYKTLHHYFGKGINDVMKHLNSLKK